MKSYEENNSDKNSGQNNSENYSYNENENCKSNDNKPDKPNNYNENINFEIEFDCNFETKNSYYKNIIHNDNSENKKDYELNSALGSFVGLDISSNFMNTGTNFILSELSEKNENKACQNENENAKEISKFSLDKSDFFHFCETISKKLK